MRTLILERAQGDRRWGYSDIARRAGFSARSFPRDVVHGRKRITPASLAPFIRGLGISGDLAEYFRLLVELEHEDCRQRASSPERIASRLCHLRARLLARGAVPINVKAEMAFAAENLPLVYAALGSPGRGATVSEVSSRTGLASVRIQSILKALVRAEIVTKHGLRFVAAQPHLNLPGLTQSEVYRKFFKECLTRARSQADVSFASDRHLFFTSCFSVRESRLATLKEELRSILLRYVDEAEEAEGERVASIVCALV
ncbi:MAG: DUF4423 domain-containing protein [Bdellovibrionota bacterium]